MKMATPICKINTRQDWFNYVNALFADVGSEFIVDTEDDVYAIYKSITNVIYSYGQNNHKLSDKDLKRVNILLESFEKAVFHKKLRQQPGKRKRDNA